MGFNYYRRIADQDEIFEVEEVDKIIKFNVLPTLAGGTLLFCATMFITLSIPFDFVSYLVSMFVYIGVVIATYAFSMRKQNGLALVFYYTTCVAAGFMQRIVLYWATLYLGDFAEVKTLFALAVLGATSVLVGIWILTRAVPSLFKAGSGFMRWGVWIPFFLVMSLSIYALFSLIFGNWDIYLLVSSVAGCLIAGIYTIWDMKMLRSRVASGRWVFATFRLQVNYFILIVRLFMLLVLGRRRR